MATERVSFHVHEDGTISRSACRERGGKARTISAQRFSFADHEIARSLQRALTPLHADWLELAAAAHFVDRLYPRPTSVGRDNSANWSRAIHLTVPVRDVEVWRKTEVASLLRDILFFTTDDDWEIEFIPRRTLRTSELQQYLFPKPFPDEIEVALFSGGLAQFRICAPASKARLDFGFFVSQWSRRLPACLVTPTNSVDVSRLIHVIRLSVDGGLWHMSMDIFWQHDFVPISII